MKESWKLTQQEKVLLGRAESEVTYEVTIHATVKAKFDSKPEHDYINSETDETTFVFKADSWFDALKKACRAFPNASKWVGLTINCLEASEK